MENIYIFNIRNRQTDYAKCLKIISLLENHENTSTNNIEAYLENINIDIIFSKFNDSTGMNKKEKLVWIENNQKNEKVIKPLDKNKFLNSLTEIHESNITRYYYFRIHKTSTEDDVVNFFYYELMNQMSWFPTENVIALIIPDFDSKKIDDCGEFYFEDKNKINANNQNGRYFDFCTLLKKSNVFGVWLNSDDELVYTNLKSFNFDNGISKTFIPLFVVNSNNFDEIVKNYIVFSLNLYEEKNDFSKIIDNFTQLSSATDLQKYFLKFANNKFTSIFSQKIKGREKRNILFSAIDEVIKENSGITYLQYLLMSLILTSNTDIVEKIFCELNDYENNDSVKNKIKSIFNSVLIKTFDFSDAISQLMENIINHSVNNFGLATARLIKKDGKQVVQVLIADANDQSNIIETFVENEEKCPEYLKKEKNNIYVSDMLNSIYNEIYWIGRKNIYNLFRDYRHDFPQYCHGLVKFANDIIALNARAVYCSTTEYCKGNDNYWKTENFNNNFDFVIPGTQILFEFEEQKNETWLNENKNVHHPVYEEYSKYLDCPNEAYLVEPIVKNISNQRDKDKLIEEYTNYWTKINESTNTISLCVDFSNFVNNKSHYEVFFKGLANFIVKNAEKSTKNFAFINFTLDMLTSLCSTFNTLNSNRVKNISIQLKCGLYVDLNEYNLNEDVLSKLSNEIFPFQLLHNGDKKSEFEKEIYECANRDLIHVSGDKHGYCLKNTHMRLGNKVHLETFYELSVLFKKQNIAMQIAYILCKQLIDMEVLKNLTNSKLIIYGYESYSKSIVFCMTEIIKKYFLLIGLQNVEVEFVLYQVDRSVGLKTTREKPYFSNQTLEKNNGMLQEYDWVLIVPISTTLTTFNKMWNKIKTSYDIDEKKVKAKLTAFWVIDGNKKVDSDGFIMPTDIEEKYWKKANVDNKTIYVNDSNKSVYRYFVYGSSKWQKPIFCDKCFPENPIDEIPLLETDPSSTVPEQQYYIKYKNDRIKSFDNKNDNYILLFKDCITYGHINRNGNHYQYYFNLPKYFQVAKNKIKNWLEGLKEKLDTKGKQFIIVSPQQNTDIEFSLYVSNYLCNGDAITLSIDSNRHFRSNIEAEYDDVKKVILDLKKDNCYFIYVDTAITSGQGFNRIRSLMSNIAYENPQFFSFDAVILLTNRLSSSSKLQYLLNDSSENFFSFVNICIPSIRTYGDSCICCNLENDCRELYKTAATKEISSYYECKMIKNYAKDFNAINDNNNDNKGFLRLVISHKVTQLLDDLHHRDVDDIEKLKEKYFDVFKSICESCLNFENNTEKDIIKMAINTCNAKENRKIYALKNAIKVISRPFYTYDFLEKSVVLDMLIMISEIIINLCSIGNDNNISLKNHNDMANFIKGLLKSSKKKYLLNNSDFFEKLCNDICCECDNNFNLLCEFYYGCILKCLMNLKSNYLIRIDTINKIFNFLKNSDTNNYEVFYKHYLAYAVYNIKHSTDCTKSLKLEKDMHIEQIKKSTAFENLWKSPKTINDKYESYFFSEFIYTLIVENTSVIYKELYALKEGDTNINSLSENECKELYEFLQEGNKECNIFELIKVLYEIYCNSKKELSGSEYFTILKDSLAKMVKLFCKTCDSVNINVFANKSISNKYYSSIYGVTDSDLDENIISEFNVKLDKEYAELSRVGYSICNESNKTEIIICFDNNKKEIEQEISDGFIEKNKIKKFNIDPVYLLISIKGDMIDYHKCLMIIRNILTFRHSVVSFIEKNFSNSMMNEKFNAQIAAKLSTVDKAGTHMSHSEFMALQYYLRLEKDDKYVSLKKQDITTEWLLLYNYTNRRIARLYNKMISVKYLMQNSELLEGQDEVYVDGNSLPQYALKNFSEIIEGEDGSRVEYYKVINRVIDFKVNNTFIHSIEEFKKSLENIKFINLQIPQNNNEEEKMTAYYSAENFFVCCLLDFCYSTIKYSNNSCDFALTGDTGIGGLYNELVKEGKKFTVKISTDFNAEYCFDGIKYGYLIFENNQATPKKEMKSGMSLDTIKWYFETLWLLNQNEIDFECRPKVLYGYDNEKFYLKLPILSAEENFNE